MANYLNHNSGYRGVDDSMLDGGRPFQTNAKERYISAFCSAFERRECVEALEYQSIPEWDSVGHKTLMGELEDVDITLEMDDIIDFGSFAKGIETPAKYGVVIE